MLINSANSALMNHNPICVLVRYTRTRGWCFVSIIFCTKGGSSNSYKYRSPLLVSFESIRAICADYVSSTAQFHDQPPASASVTRLYRSLRPLMSVHASFPVFISTGTSFRDIFASMSSMVAHYLTLWVSILH